jgi:hypothetical protein
MPQSNNQPTITPDIPDQPFGRPPVSVDSVNANERCQVLPPYQNHTMITRPPGYSSTQANWNILTDRPDAEKDYPQI